MKQQAIEKNAGRIEAALTSPHPTFRPNVYYILNAKLEHDRLRKQLTIFREAGYGGILTMPCTPLPNKVMDDDWLDAMEVMAEAALKEGLDIWVWDEWLYPSGMAGGLVTEDRRHWAKRLYIAVDVLLAPGETLTCTAPVRMLSAASCATDKHGVPAGEWRPAATGPNGDISFTAGPVRERCVVVCWDWSSNHAGTVDGKDVHSADMLSAAATDRFIELIHERYAERLGRYFGDPIKAFFYDEPTQALPFPWTERLPEEFRKRKGRDLLPELPALLAGFSVAHSFPGERPVNMIRGLADDYLDVWTDLVAENFYGRLEAWCHTHGVLSVGHLDMDHRLFNLVTVSGHFFKNHARTDHPGVDAIYNHIQPGRFTDFSRYAGSAARVLGKPRALSETGSVQGFGMSPDHVRYVLEHQIVRGVNQFFRGMTTYGVNGEAATTGQSNFGPDNAPWSNPIMAEFGAALNGRIARLSALACAGRSQVETGLYLPLHYIAATQLVASHPHTANHGFPWDTIYEMAEELTYALCEFDYLCDEGIEALEVTDGGLRTPTGIVYSTIVLPPIYSLKEPVAQKLAAFVGAGGRVLALGSVPGSLKDCASLYGGVDDLIGHVPRPVKAEGPRHRVALSGRTDGDEDLWILLNEDTRSAELTVTFPRSGQLVEVDPETGNCVVVMTGDELRLPLHFQETESRVFIRRPNDAPVAGEDTARGVDGQPIELRNWSLALPDGSRRPLNDTFPDWCELGHTQFTGSMEYRAEFEWPDTGRSGVLELGDVRHAATVQVGDGDIKQVAFQPFRVVLHDLTAGPQVLKIRVFNTQANDHSDKHYFGCDRDVSKLKSGLFGPVRLMEVVGA